MKKFLPLVLIVVLVVVAAGAIALIFGGKKQTVTHQNTATEIPSPEFSRSRKCYVYNQEATAEAPYAVEEYIDITFNGTNAFGIKKGSQSGPDMTNGYEGSLQGTVQEGVAVLVFSYVIEGSEGKEQEEYLVTPAGMIKQRYPLMGAGTMLVPDKSQEAREMIYTLTDCSKW